MSERDPRAAWSLWAGLAIAFAGQQLLTPLGESRALADLPEQWVGVGFALLVLGGLLAAVAVWATDGPRRQAGGDAREGMPSPGLLRAGLACGVTAALVCFLDPASRWAIAPWAIGLLLLAASCWQPAPARVATRLQSWEWICLSIATLVAVLYRFPDLAGAPAQVHGDEAACGLEARLILAGDVPNLLGIGWYDIPNLSFAISAASMAMFGDDLFGLRAASAILGVLSIPLLFFLVRRLFDPRAAALAAAMLACSHWHVHFSRIGTDYMQASFASLLALWFFVRALQDRRLFDWVMTGLCIGLAASVYHAGRVAPLVIAASLLLDRSAWDAPRRRGVAMMVVAAVLFVAPTVTVIARLPSALVDRSNDVFVLSQANLKHTYEDSDADDPLEVLVLQTAHSLAAFNRRGERSEQHSHRAPLLDFWSGPLFAAGLIAFTALAWKRRYRLIAIWFWSSFVLGSVLTVDAMFSPRMIVALPVVFVFAGLILERAWRLAEPRIGGVASASLVVLLLAVSGVANWNDYFGLHLHRLQPEGPPTTLARYVRRAMPGHRVYVFGHQSILYETGRFLVPDFDGVDVGPTDLEVPVADPGAGKGLAFVLDRAWQGWRDQATRIEQAYPGASRSVLARANGRPAYELLVVEPQAGNG